MKQRENKTLYQRLLQYGEGDDYPFHMPGHKRNPAYSVGEPIRYDITEITGFDNLHNSGGILQREQAFAAQLYGAAESFYLVNGSSCGVLAAVSACVRRGGRLLLCRNSHKSAYHAAYLRQLKLSYLDAKESELGFLLPATAEAVRDALCQTEGIEAVFVTSPTYEGMVSEIKDIAAAAHEAGIPVIVDEAHGAHLGFHSYFPQNALSQGADIVIQSMHKTLPSLTQTALLHIGKEAGNFADIQKIRQFLSIYQTSSPSYVFMGTMAKCLHSLNREQFECFVQRLRQFYEDCGLLQYIHVWGASGKCSQNGNAGGQFFPHDFSKLIIYTEDGLMSGQELFELFRDKYHLEFEMAAQRYVLGMTSICDREEGFERLYTALLETDALLKQKRTVFQESGTVDLSAESGKFVLGHDSQGKIYKNNRNICFPKAEYSIADAIDLEKKEIINMESCVGRVSAEYIYCYPPGTPMIVPGERVRQSDLEYIQSCIRQGLNVQGIKDNSFQKLEVIKEERQ